VAKRSGSRGGDGGLRGRRGVTPVFDSTLAVADRLRRASRVRLSSFCASIFTPGLRHQLQSFLSCLLPPRLPYPILTVSDSAQYLDGPAPTPNHGQYRRLQIRMAEQTVVKYAEQRRSRRAKIARPLRVRPSDPRDEHFEDIPISVNASKEGIYFHTRRTNYYKGMRLFVTFPFSSPHDPMNCEYVAEVVRVENLPNKRFGIAVQLKMSMNYSASAPPGSISRT